MDVETKISRDWAKDVDTLTQSSPTDLDYNFGLGLEFGNTYYTNFTNYRSILTIPTIPTIQTIQTVQTSAALPTILTILFV